jgi:hypothetical protein
MFFQEDVISHDQGTRMNEAISSNNSQCPHSRQNVRSRERGIRNDGHNSKEVASFFHNRLRELENHDEINGSVAGKVTAIPRLSIY